MTDTTNYEERTEDQTIATLYISEDGLDRDEVKEYVADYLQSNDGPSGATFIPYEGLWKGNVETGIMVEVWYDGQDELETLLGLRDGLQELFDQYCVCMRFSNDTMRHRQPAGGA